ncbi:hypothetical protein CDAR_112711 [Caerostris darwini]|uniref:Uncharacterized protein n=1 Tax=Caerostris darwini TaxID=1538125 RepID=A0AAV4Q2N7_9ARAC|nr:hypothetical protein CDAR_112711 [Caerostris darwini]
MLRERRREMRRGKMSTECFPPIKKTSSLFSFLRGARHSGFRQWDPTGIPRTGSLHYDVGPQLFWTEIVSFRIGHLRQLALDGLGFIGVGFCRVSQHRLFIV